MLLSKRLDITADARGDGLKQAVCLQLWQEGSPVDEAILVTQESREHRTSLVFPGEGEVCIPWDLEIGKTDLEIFQYEPFVYLNSAFTEPVYSNLRLWPRCLERGYTVRVRDLEYAP